jgi:hypothetical protein
MGATALFPLTNWIIIAEHYQTSREIKNEFPGEYLCPECLEAVVPVSSDGFRVCHFRHMDGSVYCTKRASNEGENHELTKADWFNLANELNAEHRIGVSAVREKNMGQFRPDITFLVTESNARAAGEIQLSAIKPVDLFARYNGHLSEGALSSTWRCGEAIKREIKRDLVKADGFCLTTHVIRTPREEIITDEQGFKIYAKTHRADGIRKQIYRDPGLLSAEDFTRGDEALFLENLVRQSRDGRISHPVDLKAIAQDEESQLRVIGSKEKLAPLSLTEDPTRYAGVTAYGEDRSPVGCIKDFHLESNEVTLHAEDRIFRVSIDSISVGENSCRTRETNGFRSITERMNGIKEAAKVAEIERLRLEREAEKERRRIERAEKEAARVAERERRSREAEAKNERLRRELEQESARVAERERLRLEEEAKAERIRIERAEQEAIRIAEFQRRLEKALPIGEGDTVSWVTAPAHLTEFDPFQVLNVDGESAELAWVEKRVPLSELMLAVGP